MVVADMPFVTVRPETLVNPALNVEPVESVILNVLLVLLYENNAIPAPPPDVNPVTLTIDPSLL